jgi:hypothetical protein
MSLFIFIYQNYSFSSPSSSSREMSASSDFSFPSGATLIFPSELSMSGFDFLASFSSFSGAKDQTLLRADFNFFLVQGKVFRNLRLDR